MTTLPIPGSCCTPCTETPSVAVPGPSGSDGADGQNGADGVSAYSVVSIAFVMPAEGANVAISVDSTAWMVVGQLVYIATAGYIQVQSITNANTFVGQNVENTGSSAYLPNAAPGTNIPASSKVSPSGIQGPAGTLSGPASGDLESNYPSPRVAITNTKGDLMVNNNGVVAPRNTRLAVGADGSVLHARSATGTGLQWAGIDLTGVLSTLSGALGIARGGTGQTTQTAGFNALSPLTTRGDLITRDATNNVRLAIGAANRVLRANGTDPSWGQVVAGDLDPALARLSGDYILIREEQASGNNAGDFTSGAWRTRALNTETSDVGALAAVAASQVTLQPGTYRFKAFATAYQVDNHKLRLRNITAGTDIALGMNARSGSGDNGMSLAMVEGRFTIVGATVLELQHQCQTTNAGDGMGLASSFGVEVYATLELWREAQ